MKLLVAITLLALLSSACSSGSSTAAPNAASHFTEDEKHRLYSAALAASDSPLDGDTFKDVCRKIEIFDASGAPNDHYMTFVSQHVNWSIKSETDQFRSEISSKEKAQEYLKQHLAR